MSGTLSKPREPLSAPQRWRAFWQGVAGSLGSLALFAGLNIAAEWLPRGEMALRSLAAFAALAAAVVGLWKLSVARAGRWDALGVVALVLLLPGFLLLFFLASWCAVVGNFLVTGRPFTPFGH